MFISTHHVKGFGPCLFNSLFLDRGETVSHGERGKQFTPGWPGSRKEKGKGSVI